MHSNQELAPPAASPEVPAWFTQAFDQRLENKLAERAAAHRPAMTVIATKGTLDMAYPPFILASTAAALGWEVSVFFTFYGLNLLKRELDLKITPLGNPAMPMRLPHGPSWLAERELKVPTPVMALMPGFEQLASDMMRKMRIPHPFGHPFHAHSATDSTLIRPLVPRAFGH